MTRDEKQAVIEELREAFSTANTLYVTDSSELTVEAVNNLRRLCHSKGITMRVAKNTLIKKAMESVEGADFSGLYETLVGPTALMFSEVSNAPAKVIKEFRESSEKPVLKAAYIDTDVYLGDEHVEALSKLKSKEELIGEIIGLLQSPAKNVIGALQSGGSTIAGLIKTLSEREEAN